MHVNYDGIRRAPYSYDQSILHIIKFRKSFCFSLQTTTFERRLERALTSNSSSPNVFDILETGVLSESFSSYSATVAQLPRLETPTGRRKRSSSCDWSTDTETSRL